MSDFKLVSKFLGYRNKTDPTNIPELVADDSGRPVRASVLIAGSQNITSVDADRIGIRPGYTLDGSASTSSNPIRSSYDWITHRGENRNVRHYSDTLEYRYVAADGTVSWRTLLTGLSTTATLQFAEFWDTSELQDMLLFVDGTSNIYEWTGALTTIASVGTNTLTKSGTSTWAEAGFYTSGTRQVVINGVTYTYSGGESSTTLTGVTPDPALASPAIAAGDIVHQAIRTTANSVISGIPTTFPNDLIGVLYNQIYVASLTSRFVYVSKQNNYKDYSYSTTRVPAEGALFTLDAAIVGFVPQEEAMYITAGKSFWYETVFQKSADLTKESLDVKRLKTSGQKAAKSQVFISNDGNNVIFVSNEPTFDQLGRVENITTPQNKPLSDPIKTDFDDYDFSVDGDVVRYRNNQYIAIPASGVVLVYNFEKGFWEAPWIMSIRCFSVIDGELYGHSSLTAETYKLLDGTSDNGNPIEAIAQLNYQNYGDRAAKKTFDEWFSEGYISSNTTLTLGLKYDFGGFTSIVEKEISGNDDTIIFATTTDNSLGKNPIGQLPIGSITDSPSDLPKFRVIHELERQDFYELSALYQTDDVDAQWQILCCGGNVELSTADNNEIKQ